MEFIGPFALVAGDLVDEVVQVDGPAISADLLGCSIELAATSVLAGWYVAAGTTQRFHAGLNFFDCALCVA
jgi:hypothetical protein